MLATVWFGFLFLTLTVVLSMYLVASGSKFGRGNPCQSNGEFRLYRDRYNPLELRDFFKITDQVRCKQMERIKFAWGEPTRGDSTSCGGFLQFAPKGRCALRLCSFAQNSKFKFEHTFQFLQIKITVHQFSRALRSSPNNQPRTARDVFSKRAQPNQRNSLLCRLRDQARC